MFIAIYNKDNGENKQGDIHSKNVWEFAPLLPHITRVEIPTELDGKEFNVSKVVDLALRWQLEASTVYEQPRLLPHWYLNGSVLFEEPMVTAFSNGEIVSYEQPLKDAWDKEGEVQVEVQPLTAEYWYKFDDSENESLWLFQDSENGPTLTAWREIATGHVIYEDPNDDVLFVEELVGDHNYHFQGAVADESWTKSEINDETYLEVQVTDPDATAYLEEVDDYRYMRLEEEFHFELSEDVEATEAAAKLASIAKLKAFFVEIRVLWQDRIDDMATENSMLGIAAIEGKTEEIATAFIPTEQWLRLNCPKQAIASIDDIARDDVFNTEERLTGLKATLQTFLDEH